MTDKELHRLKRAQLLEIMLEQSREIERLQKRVAVLEEELNARNIMIANTGSIAEASLLLNHIFEDAQKAANLYLENVERVCKEKAIEAGAEQEWRKKFL